MKISIIIPTCHESERIEKLVHTLKNNSSERNIQEIIVVDACSGDNTAEIAKRAGAKVFLTERRGRALQMNTGANLATGDIFYFLHADTIPPKKFDERILQSIKDGNDAGCFRMKFDSKHPFFRFFSWFTRFNNNLCRFGDQSLFAKRDLFGKINGFDINLEIMEDNDIVRRITKQGKFSVIPDYVVTSARRYRKNGMLRLQWNYTVINILYYLGFSQEEIVRYYQNHIQ